MGLGPEVDIKNTVQGPWTVLLLSTQEKTDVLGLLRPLIPATFGLTCAGEEGPGQVLWVVEPREHAWGRGPAKKIQLCGNLQLVGVQLHLQGNRVCTKAVCKGLDIAQGKASTDNLD